MKQITFFLCKSTENVTGADNSIKFFVFHLPLHYKTLQYLKLFCIYSNWYENLIFKAWKLYYATGTYYFLRGKNVFMKKIIYLVISHRINPKTKNLTFSKLVKNKLYHDVSIKNYININKHFYGRYFPHEN